MFSNLFKPNSESQKLINEYKKLRHVGQKLSEKISEKFTDEKSLGVVGRALGILQGNTFILESDEEMNFFIDFSLFEYQVNGKNFIERYLEECPDSDEVEIQLLQAQLVSYTSLFKIVETDPNQGITKFEDLLNKQEVSTINLNLSKTSYPGLLLFTRIYPLPQFNVTSGMYALFPANSERALLKQAKIIMKKVKSEQESVQRFVAFFKLNRKMGLETGTKSV